MSDEIGIEDLRMDVPTKADPDRRAFNNRASDARPDPGAPDWNDYAYLFNHIGGADFLEGRRLQFSQRHYIADHLYKLGYRLWPKPAREVPMVDFLERYVEERGIGMPFYTNGSKIIEEAEELRDAVLAQDKARVMEEAADVCITALVAARQFGFSIEEALEAKIAKDAGRGPKLNDPNEQGGVRPFSDDEPNTPVRPL